MYDPNGLNAPMSREAAQYPPHCRHDPYGRGGFEMARGLRRPRSGTSETKPFYLTSESALGLDLDRDRD
jgi:hypothetical protein